MTRNEKQARDHEALTAVAKAYLEGRPNCIRDIRQRGADAQEPQWVEHLTQQAQAQASIMARRMPDAYDIWHAAMRSEKQRAILAAVIELQA